MGLTRSAALGMLAKPAWMERAACRGMNPELFHPHRGEDSSPAKRVCAECPVREECLDWAVVAKEKQGVWGGVTERHRRSMRRTRVA